MSTLPRGGACALALEPDCGAEDSRNQESDRRAPSPLLKSPGYGSAGLHDAISESMITQLGHTKRGKATLATSERIVELTALLAKAEIDLQEANAELDVLRRRDERWHSLSGTSFAGVAMAQYWVDLLLWEGLLNEKDYDTIVEIGTSNGGLSLYLAAQAKEREINFRTYDVHVPEHKIPGFVKLDVFALSEEVGAHLSKHEPIILLCDGGNKPRELKTFSTYLTPASTIVVHDWGTEVSPSDVPANVEMIHKDWCEDLGSFCRVFRVKDV